MEIENFRAAKQANIFYLAFVQLVLPDLIQAKIRQFVVPVPPEGFLLPQVLLLSPPASPAPQAAPMLLPWALPLAPLAPWVLLLLAPGQKCVIFVTLESIQLQLARVCVHPVRQVNPHQQQGQLYLVHVLIAPPALILTREASVPPALPARLQ